MSEVGKVGGPGPGQPVPPPEQISSAPRLFTKNGDYSYVLPRLLKELKEFCDKGVDGSSVSETEFMTNEVGIARVTAYMCTYSSPYDPKDTVLDGILTPLIIRVNELAKAKQSGQSGEQEFEDIQKWTGKLDNYYNDEPIPTG